MVKLIKMEDLIRKISEIYFKYGIKSVTMDDLARELGQSKKTLYQHFEDKEDVVKKVINFLIHHQECGIEETLENPAYNAIDRLFHMSRFLTAHLQTVNPAVSYDLQKYYPKVWDELLAFKRKTIFEHIMTNSRQGIKEGLYIEDLNHEIIANVYVSRMEMYAVGNWQGLDKFSFEEFFKTLFIYHVRGITSPKGVKYLESLIRQEDGIQLLRR